MGLTTTETDDAVVLTPATTVRASVIWLHGLGADGHDFVPIVPELRLPEALGIRFVFPHAPVRAVTINNGYQMRAWYDIKSLAADERADPAGLAESVARVDALVAAETAAGIPAGRIVLAGFSQGGAVALHAALTAPARLAGVIGLSTYLPLATRLTPRLSAANRGLPVLLCHGQRDPVLSLEMGLAGRDVLVGAGYPVEWHEFPMEHEVSLAEITLVARWLAARLA